MGNANSRSGHGQSEGPSSHSASSHSASPPQPPQKKQEKFTTAEISQLHAHFRRLAASSPDHPNQITKEQFAEALALAGITAALHPRLFAAFDASHSQTLDFREYILGLGMLSRGTKREKLQLSFQVYDVDRSGAISKAEMVEVLGSAMPSASQGPSKRSSTSCTRCATSTAAESSRTWNISARRSSIPRFSPSSRARRPSPRAVAAQAPSTAAAPPRPPRPPNNFPRTRSKHTTIPPSCTFRPLKYPRCTPTLPESPPNRRKTSTRYTSTNFAPRSTRAPLSGAPAGSSTPSSTRSTRTAAAQSTFRNLFSV